MPLSAESLDEAIRSKIKDGLEHVVLKPDVSKQQVFDISGGCGQSYEVIIVSEAFQKLPTFKRHKLVYGALRDEINQLHAFSQKTFTPEEWKNVEVTVADTGPAIASSEPVELIKQSL